MKPYWAILFIVLAVFLTAGAIFFLTRPPLGEEITLLPPPTPAPLLIDISGAVVSPGIYNFPRESRVADAVEAAGGLAENADRSAINLAAFLLDGQKITIPFIPKPGETAVNPESSTTTRVESVTLPTSGPVNVNTASKAELETLPRIGPSTADKIISYREEHGPFMDVEDLLDVPGIGPATLETIRELVTVGR